MPPAPIRPARLHGRVFRGSAVLREGWLTRGQLRSSAWQRVFPDVYACSTLDVTHRVRTVAAVRVLLPGAVASGHSAGVWWGADLAGPDDVVDCTLPPGAHHGGIDGVRLRRRRLAPEDVVTWWGLAVTSPVRTVLDLAALRPPDEAVVAVDRFLRLGRVSLADARAAGERLVGRDCRLVRSALARADGLAESPQETRLRLILHAAPLPRPVAQYVVLDAGGRFVARVDLAWPEHRLAVEYEGTWHGQPQQVARDRARLNRLTAAGWRVVFVTAADLHREAELVARICAALGAPRSA
ncbi:T/G mismatch-specific endonuclease [Geodermatophilus pulveris]|uniref:T/G mismatch-specific endonuclease n=1 Tax=Geodermatophilus pulveris TaxID=1564159 RepID=A0A239BA86_9ACTN|nr:hypothetical protein [Geodermatophilus pulveris]SNS04877.1 T/G mismatch-specific endonuclease [Geodermatophilus pulveris]